MLMAGSTAAQSLRVNGSTSTVTVPAAPDYAAEVKGDPWDFDKSSDYVYTYSLGAHAVLLRIHRVAAIPDGARTALFSGVTLSTRPSLQMLFGGIPGAMNAQQDTGLRFPIDAARYTTLSFRVRRSWPAGDSEGLGVGWEKGRRGTSPRGTLVVLAKGFDNNTARWTNQNPLAQQGAANEWQVYRVRLTDAQLFPGNRFNTNDSRWTGQVMGAEPGAGRGSCGVDSGNGLGAADRTAHRAARLGRAWAARWL